MVSTELPTFAVNKVIMKRNISFILAGVLLVALGGCKGKKQKQEDVVTLPTITWLTETEHDFGTYHERDTVAFDFVYRNEGPGDFVIERLEGTCGCTRAHHSRQSVAPGQNDTIHVTYDGNGFTPGYFIKGVNIYAAGKLVDHLQIKGVYEPQEEPQAE